jgi:hypothetical protein
MSLESIADRVHRDHLAHNSLYPGELLVPSSLRRRRVQPSDITHAEWFNSLRNCLQEGIDLGLFGTLTLDRAIDKIVTGLNAGACKGLAAAQ